MGLVPAIVLAGADIDNADGDAGCCRRSAETRQHERACGGGPEQRTACNQRFGHAVTPSMPKPHRRAVNAGIDDVVLAAIMTRPASCVWEAASPWAHSRHQAFRRSATTPRQGRTERPGLHPTARDARPD